MSPALNKTATTPPDATPATLTNGPAPTRFIDPLDKNARAFTEGSRFNFGPDTEHRFVAFRSRITDTELDPWLGTGGVELGIYADSLLAFGLGLRWERHRDIGYLVNYSFYEDASQPPLPLVIREPRIFPAQRLRLQLVDAGAGLLVCERVVVIPPAFGYRLNERVALSWNTNNGRGWFDTLNEIFHRNFPDHVRFFEAAAKRKAVALAPPA